MTTDPRLPHDDRELNALDAALGEPVTGSFDPVDAATLERAAAVATAALLRGEGHEAMPAGLADRVRAALNNPPEPLAILPPGPQGKSRGWWWSGLAAAVLMCALAFTVVRAMLPATSPQAKWAAVYADANRVEAPWSMWPRNESNPEAQEVAFADSVTGRVVWSEDRQQGVMEFVGLPENDPSVEQYQLWIIVPDQAHPIDGGVFDVSKAARSGDGKAYVPITPKLRVRDAAAFAVTIEPPGGVVVSAQARRVVVAAPTKS